MKCDIISGFRLHLCTKLSPSTMSSFLFPFISVFIFTLLLSNFTFIQGQQPYIGLATNACPRKGDSKSIRGYTCNGPSTCQAYLTFRSQPIYSSVSTISSLLSSNPSQVAEINSVSLNHTFETNTIVIVPVNCSCTGSSNYYQANTSYVVQNTDTYFLIANNTFEGLSTCQALMHENHNPGDIYPGRKLLVPLRCACPTKNQTQNGIKYLLSYLVNWGDSVSLISQKFGVKTKTTLEANTLSLIQSTIYPFTTLLVPLHEKPSNFQTLLPPQPSPSSSSSRHKSSNKKWVFVVIGMDGIGKTWRESSMQISATNAIVDDDFIHSTTSFVLWFIDNTVIFLIKMYVASDGYHTSSLELAEQFLTRRETRVAEQYYRRRETREDDNARWAAEMNGYFEACRKSSDELHGSGVRIISCQDYQEGVMKEDEDEIQYKKETINKLKSIK